MHTSRWVRITLLLLHLFGSATSSPLSVHTPAPPLPSQISPPFPTFLPSGPCPSISIPPIREDSAERPPCPLTMSPSTLVVRFGDPVKANCSVSRTEFSLLGWEVSLVAPEPTMEHYLVWSVDNMTEWSISAVCYAVSNLDGSCQLPLPVIVYKPPDSVSISFVNHTGPLFEHHQYTLQCTVQDVAPARNLVVTFYRDQTRLSRLRSAMMEKTPVTEVFTLDVQPRREDDGALYWCEAELQLQPGGPQWPLTVTSQKLPAAVLFGPQLLCPAKLQVRMGESLHCEVQGNPKPSVIWLKDGRLVVPPTHSMMEHAGKYTVLATGLFGQRNLTVEVEVITSRGTARLCKRHFLFATLLLLTWNL
ncbi:intercellular adhesion molecule 1-like isoform X1 [Dunckerocampus dactyliophorus]|uniref:intercellular adhesion molecule 1-like isoform X1 n=1 Tax=Dunckerocampus dactyliophorus TaxID=161453 RepID=UPI00240542B3|nr:intercellular adhesion molecule 1-like isoform X1 [Dunckerocampus dactyliophorus]